MRPKAYVAADYLDEALASFSGYLAADELYDGPFCVLSIVDNRALRRLVYEVAVPCQISTQGVGG
jgi:hypothetical protein